MLHGIQGLLEGLDAVHLLVDAALDRCRGVPIFVPELDGPLIACAKLLQILGGIIPGDYRILHGRFNLLDNLHIATLD